jgi:hypothetical protein
LLIRILRLFRRKVFLILCALFLITYAASNVETVIVFCNKMTHLQNCWAQESGFLPVFALAPCFFACGGWFFCWMIIELAKERKDPKWRRRFCWIEGLSWAFGAIAFYFLIQLIAAHNQPDSLRILHSWPGLLATTVTCINLGVLSETFVGGRIYEVWQRRSQHIEQSKPN